MRGVKRSRRKAVVVPGTDSDAGLSGLTPASADGLVFDVRQTIKRQPAAINRKRMRTWPSPRGSCRYGKRCAPVTRHRFLPARDAHAGVRRCRTGQVYAARCRCFSAEIAAGLSDCSIRTRRLTSSGGCPFRFHLTRPVSACTSIARWFQTWLMRFRQLIVRNDPEGVWLPRVKLGLRYRPVGTCWRCGYHGAFHFSGFAPGRRCRVICPECTRTWMIDDELDHCMEVHLAYAPALTAARRTRRAGRDAPEYQAPDPWPASSRHADAAAFPPGPCRLCCTAIQNARTPQMPQKAAARWSRRSRAHSVSHGAARARTIARSSSSGLCALQ